MPMNPQELSKAFRVYEGELLNLRGLGLYFSFG